MEFVEDLRTLIPVFTSQPPPLLKLSLETDFRRLRLDGVFISALDFRCLDFLVCFGLEFAMVTIS